MGPGWRRHLNLIAVVLGVVMLLALLTFFLASRQTDLSEEPSIAPTGTPASPVISPTDPAVASPAGEVIDYPAGSLPALLELAPDQLDADQTGLPIQATYADIEGWLASMGLDHERLTDDELERAIEPLEIPETLKTRGLSAEWHGVYGFDLRQVDQVLAVGHAPNQILIMPGRYDAESLYATWVESGYQAVEVEEMTIWSLSPGDRIDLTAPASRPALGLLNTVVLLDNGTLIATARQSRMAEALRTVQGDADSLLDHDLLHDAVVAPVNATSPCVVIASGTLLQRPATAETGTVSRVSPAAGASPAIAEPVPSEPDVLVFALVPPRDGGTMPVVMTMIYDDPPDDIMMLPAVLKDRVAQDAAWSTRFRLESITVTGEDNDMIEIRFSPVSGEAAGLDLVENRNLEPFTWSEGN